MDKGIHKVGIPIAICCSRLKHNEFKCAKAEQASKAKL